MHRDIKMENILFESKEEDSEIKLIDFGLSTIYAKQRQKVALDEPVGTLYTMAPEVFMEQYDLQADMWSIGVVAYILLSGIKPFWSYGRYVSLKKKSVGWSKMLSCCRVRSILADVCSAKEIHCILV